MLSKGFTIKCDALENELESLNYLILEHPPDYHTIKTHKSQLTQERPLCSKPLKRMGVRFVGDIFWKMSSIK